MSDEIVEERVGAVMVLTLNRPRALNALSHAMCTALHAAYARAEADDAIRAVVLKSASDRAFCSGGDVRAVQQRGPVRAPDGQADPSRAFFAAEYRMNHALHHLTKPHIALIDGIVMGGGAGISVHGSHRVVSERALFAMPECAIGLFPDVGGGWFLPRCPGETGTWLGLTGARIGGADMLALGLATHGVPSERLAALCEALLAADWQAGPAEAVADDVIGGFTGPVGEEGITARRAVIDRCFSGDTVEAILDAVDADLDPTAVAAGAAMRGGSPTSLRLTLAQLRQGRTMPYDAVARMEYRMVCRVLRGHDFFEGVRAALVDKDRQPRWQPAGLAEIPEAAIAPYFAPLPAEAELDLG